MSLIPTKRLQQGLFEALVSQNRAAGSGGGSGMVPALVLGFAAAGNQGAYSTVNSGTWTDITNTSFTIMVNRASLFEYYVYAAAHLSAAGATGYIRGNIVNYDTSASLQFGPTTVTNGFMPYFPTSKGPIQGGTYTVKLQAATDNNTFNITVDQFFHYFKVYAFA